MSPPRISSSRNCPGLQRVCVRIENLDPHEEAKMVESGCACVRVRRRHRAPYTLVSFPPEVVCWEPLHVHAQQYPDNGLLVSYVPIPGKQKPQLRVVFIEPETRHDVVPQQIISTKRSNP